MNPSPADPLATCEYVVVGSGAGGGTVAARLAEAGHRVVLLEAGGDPRAPERDPAEPGAERLPDDYDVPLFHPFASENAAMRWDFFVRHYADDARQAKDAKYRVRADGRAVDGVLYPRAGTLGGCTAHNAMIFVCPHDGDWDRIADLTGDASWSARHMRRYFERLENCRHRPVYRWLAKLGINPTRHGFRGWLHTEKAIPLSVVKDERLLEVILDCASESLADIGHPVERAHWALHDQMDPNDWRTVRADAVGVRYLPLSTRRHVRMGSRERVLDVAARHPDRLRIELDALATRVLLDGDGRATGVEYRSGRHLYRAHPSPSDLPGELRQVHASREVILAGGAFNSPQLLMLSGVGPAAELRRHGLPVVVDLPGVGRNLQDRYEIGVVNRMDFREWDVLDGALFERGDPLFARWQSSRCGAYDTNGSILAMFRRSKPERPLPDLFCFALLGRFEGYYPGYSKVFATERNCLTWAILKAHTNNRAGTVTLRSADPFDTPEVNFRYFEEGTADGGEDLDSIVEGVRFARRMMTGLRARGLVLREELPGDDVQSDEDLRAFIRANAWGHHASCSCAIGPREAGGVLDSAFRVHGTKGLRVVDASVFPRIPGFFIASAVYMVGEKAADAILADVRD